MSYLHSKILDYGLNVIVQYTTRLLIHEVEPTDYESAILSSLGQKDDPVISGPENANIKGRQVTVAPITDGVGTADGTVKFWSLVDDGSQILLAADQVENEFSILDGNSFTMSVFSIILPGAGYG